MSRAREIQRLREEIEMLHGEPRAERQPGPSLEDALEAEREAHAAELREIRGQAAQAFEDLRAEAKRVLDEETARLRAHLEQERGNLLRLRGEVERLSGALTAARREAAGHRLLRRELEVQLAAARESRDAATERADQLLGIIRDFARSRETSGAPDRVISLEDRLRSPRPSS